MVRAGEALHRMSGYAHMAYDKARVAKLAFIALGRPDVFFLEAITLDDLAIGVLFAGVKESYFGPDKIASDIVFFIAPEFWGRCGDALREIVENYRTWATDQGAKKIFLGTSTEVNPDKTRDVFEALGFPQTGSLHAVTVH